MKKFWWLAAATTLVVTSFSMFGPVLAVLLQQRGMGTAAVGAFAMIPFACVALLIPIMPRIFARFGIGRVYLAGMVLESVCTLGYIAFMDSPHAFAWWCASAVAGGVGAAAVWNATEALLAEHAPPDKRGQVMGLYQTALGAALAAGPFVPVFLGWEAKTTLIAAAIVQFAALGIALRLKLTQAAHTHVHEEGTKQIGSTWQAVRLVPALVLIAFAGGVFEAGLSSISAANGAALGLSLAQASSIVGALGVGSFVFQYPAGLAADRFAPQRVFGVAGLLLLVASLAFAASAQWPWLLYATAVIWGGIGGALYTLTMIRVAHHFDASMGAQAVASGTAAMITGYTLGGALGPIISGTALQVFSAWGLSAWLALLSVAVILASFKAGISSKKGLSPA
ncbi:MFS transporter [Variovorax sp. PCZ-1]|uniref:MFS transporter n=1 Tax=Variovorax sp. PCZ-1 TaxID=2835533 RepID=UPI001BCB7693|nr:MFS transporter [Variovorax sp. PCZ-1]MBS7808730.1 MFS transporter [Variovorax sp. PCZ-1]